MNSVLIRDIPENERPRERLLFYGAKNISNEELLSIILKTGTKDKSVKDISNMILKEVKDISNLKDIGIGSFNNIKGIGKTKTITLMAAIELGRRVYNNKNKLNKQIKSSMDIYEEMSFLRDAKQENFYILYLDNKKKIIESKLLYVGTINGSIAHPREIFKYAYLDSASFIVCIHNHPTGDTTPSNEDINLTNHLIEIGKLNNIPILDHIIIGDGYYSFFEDKKYKF